MEMEETLIDFVKTNDCLYNPKARYYRKMTYKQQMWNEIGQILQTTGTYTIFNFW